MKTGQILAAAVMALTAGSAAQAVTIATFADPTSGPVPSLFQWDATTQTLTGGWSNPGLLLQTPGTSAIDFVDATFQLTPMVATSTLFGISFFGPGAIQFFDSAANPIFRIEFDSALLNSSLSFGASDFVGFNVRFSGSILDFPTQNEAFAFSFANPVAAPANGGFTVTSSFTSSADRLIPAPGALALMGCGGLMLARRRR